MSSVLHPEFGIINPNTQRDRQQTSSEVPVLLLAAAQKTPCKNVAQKHFSLLKHRSGQ